MQEKERAADGGSHEVTLTLARPHAGGRGGGTALDSVGFGVLTVVVQLSLTHGKPFRGDCRFKHPDKLCKAPACRTRCETPPRFGYSRVMSTQTNWSGNVAYKYKRYHEPTSIEERSRL